MRTIDVTGGATVCTRGLRIFVQTERMKNIGRQRSNGGSLRLEGLWAVTLSRVVLVWRFQVQESCA